MNVLIMGAGYVGLVSAVCYAALGHDVLCVEVDAEKCMLLQQGKSPFYEPGLEEKLREQMAAGRLNFAGRVPNSADADIAVIAVGTPPMPSGAADVSYVFNAVKELTHKLGYGAVIATKSTVPVGTGQQIAELLRAWGRGDLDVASIPEFLREGTALADAMNPHRLVFGLSNERALDILKALHNGLDAPHIVCDLPSAEMIKYASNAFLATKISFINEVANVCERVGADVSTVARGMGFDPRIGASFLRAGLGYGGSCFPKDTRSLMSIAGNVDYDFKLLKAVVEVNERQRLLPMDRLREWFGDLNGKIVTLLGLAFKPGTDDTRETPALELAAALREAGAVVRGCDPIVRRLPVSGDEVRLYTDPYEALEGADAVVLVTEWPEYVELDWLRAVKVMKQPYLFDGRNVLEPEAVGQAGFTLGNVGRRTPDLLPL